MPDSTAALVNLLGNPPNPMDQVTKTLGGVNALMDFRANQAAMDAYRQSVDPTTGEFDMGKFNALLSQAPGGSWNFGKSMLQSGQGQQAQGLGTQADVQARMDQLNGIAGTLQPLMTKVLNGEQVTTADLQGALSTAKGLGLTTPAMERNFQRQIDSGGNPNDIVRGAMYGTVSGQQRLQTVLGNITGVNQGPQTTFVQTQPGAAQPAAGPVPMGLNPQNIADIDRYLNEPFEWTDRNGVQQKGTKGTYYQQMQGVNDPRSLFINSRTVPAPGSPPPAASTLTAPAGAGGGPVSSVTTGRAPVPSGGNVPTPGLPGNAASRPGAPAAPTPPPAPSAAPPPAPAPAAAPSTASLPDAEIKAGQAQYQADQLTARQLPERLNPLFSAMAVLRTNPDLQTGPGQAQWNQAVTGIAAALNMPVPQSTKDYQELAKFLAQNIRAQNTGNSTDLGRLETEASNPNPTTQSRQALQILLAKQVGLTRMQTAGLAYFKAKYPDAAAASINSGRYNVETTDWRSKQDPTAYAIDQMSPDEVKRYFDGLSGTVDPKTGEVTGEKKTFIESKREAERLYNLRPSPNAVTVPPPAPPPKPPPPSPRQTTSPPTNITPNIYGSGVAPAPGTP